MLTNFLNNEFSPVSLQTSFENFVVWWKSIKEVTENIFMKAFDNFTEIGKLNRKTLCLQKQVGV